MKLAELELELELPELELELELPELELELELELNSIESAALAQTVIYGLGGGTRDNN